MRNYEIDKDAGLFSVEYVPDQGVGAFVWANIADNTPTVRNDLGYIGKLTNELTGVDFGVGSFLLGNPYVVFEIGGEDQDLQHFIFDVLQNTYFIDASSIKTDIIMPSSLAKPGLFASKVKRDAYLKIRTNQRYPGTVDEINQLQDEVGSVRALRVFGTQDIVAVVAPKEQDEHLGPQQLGNLVDGIRNMRGIDNISVLTCTSNFHPYQLDELLRYPGKFRK